MSNKYDRHYPAIPLRNVTVFPGMVMHFDVSRKKMCIRDRYDSVCKKAAQHRKNS